MTGLLTIRSALDRETVREYNLGITASDSGLYRLTASTTVNIVVVDVNDNPPRFEQAVYNVDIEENRQSNSQVIVVRATDPDHGELSLCRMICHFRYIMTYR